MKESNLHGKWEELNWYNSQPDLQTKNAHVERILEIGCLETRRDATCSRDCSYDTRPLTGRLHRMAQNSDCRMKCLSLSEWSCKILACSCRWKYCYKHTRLVHHTMSFKATTLTNAQKIFINSKSLWRTGIPCCFLFSSSLFKRHNMATIIPRARVCLCDEHEPGAQWSMMYRTQKVVFFNRSFIYR